MIAEGTVKEADYVAAQFLHIKPRLIFAIIGLVLLAVFVWVFIEDPSVIAFGVVVYLVSWFFFYIPWRAKRSFRQYKALSEPSSIEVREEGLYFKRENGEGLVPWSHILKWRHNKRLLLLYPANNIFYMVPHHFFASAELYVEFVKIIEERSANVT